MLLSFSVVAFLMLAFVVLFIFWPFVDPESTRVDELSRESQLEAYRSLLQQRELSLQSLADVELDESMGKLTQEDFQSIKEDLLKEIAELDRRLQLLEESDPFLSKVHQELQRLASEQR